MLDYDSNAFTLTDQPVRHILPAIYEDLGLPDLSSFPEQHFEFTYELGKKEGNGKGSVRLYKGETDIKVVLLNKLPGIGTGRLQTLKEILLEKLGVQFLVKAKSGDQFQKIYYTDFRRCE